MAGKALNLSLVHARAQPALTTWMSAAGPWMYGTPASDSVDAQFMYTAIISALSTRPMRTTSQKHTSCTSAATTGKRASRSSLMRRLRPSGKPCLCVCAYCASAAGMGGMPAGRDVGNTHQAGILVGPGLSQAMAAASSLGSAGACW